MDSTINTEDFWRRRVEVESTIRLAKSRIAGFEGREGHRTPFAPVANNHESIGVTPVPIQIAATASRSPLLLDKTRIASRFLRANA
jgi:hypothetical protein